MLLQQKIRTKSSPWKFIVAGLVLLLIATLAFLFVFTPLGNIITHTQGYEAIGYNLLIFFFVGTPCFIIGLVNLARGIARLWGHSLIGYILLITSLLLFFSMVVPTLRMVAVTIFALITGSGQSAFGDYMLIACLYIVSAFPTSIVFLLQAWRRRRGLLPTI